MAGRPLRRERVARENGARYDYKMPNMATASDERARANSESSALKYKLRGQQLHAKMQLWVGLRVSVAVDPYIRNKYGDRPPRIGRVVKAYWAPEYEGDDRDSPHLDVVFDDDRYQEGVSQETVVGDATEKNWFPRVTLLPPASQAEAKSHGDMRQVVPVRRARANPEAFESTWWKHEGQRGIPFPSDRLRGDVYSNYRTRESVVLLPVHPGSEGSRGGGFEFLRLTGPHDNYGQPLYQDDPDENWEGTVIPGVWGSREGALAALKRSRNMLALVEEGYKA